MELYSLPRSILLLDSLFKLWFYLVLKDAKIDGERNGR